MRSCHTLIRTLIVVAVLLNGHLFLVGNSQKYDRERPQSQPMEDVEILVDVDHLEAGVAVLQAQPAIQDNHASLKHFAFDRQAAPIYVDLLHQSVRLQI